ncbi:uncharacterized protein LOC141649868 [Silene latifolia]|uniref:uncharacterized protein LOC141649868 n=1 Tax=Silene latifolia TaxID=37657 RepID=UPI003D7837E7
MGPNSEIDRAIRIRILIDVRHPLKAVVPIRVKEGRIIHFDVKYERLPIFCYGCGTIGHGEKDCEHGPYDDDDDLLFGEWLRASPWKIVKTVSDGPGKARRDLNAEFDMMKKKEDAEADIAKMIEKLQNIAINFKSKKREGGRGLSTIEEKEEGQLDHILNGWKGEDREGVGCAVVEAVVDDEGLDEHVGAEEDGGGRFVADCEVEGGGENQHGMEVDGVVRRGVDTSSTGSGTESGRDRGRISKSRCWTRLVRDSQLLPTEKTVALVDLDFTIRDDNKVWRVTGFYGWPAVADRHLSWQLLRILSRQSDLPWVCIWDFNEILFYNEMKGGSRAQWQMNNFHEAVNDCGLQDVAWEGYKFTFDNGQNGVANRQSMIDRAMCTSYWLDLFPYAKLLHLDQEWSDHAPIKLVLNTRELGGGRRRSFHFEQIWVGEEGCEEAVIKGFEKGQGRLVKSIRECARELGDWKKISIGKINWALENKRKILAQLNQGGRAEEEVKHMRKIVAEIAELSRQEEQYWRQISRALWLRDGDRNTTFFHTRAGERKRKKFIGKLIDDSGVERTDDEAFSRVANNYFTELFTSVRPSDFEDVLQGIEGRVTDRMNLLLRADYREEEIVEALNQMDPLKAPGSDVVSTVLHILNGNESAKPLNKTNIVLIPKKKAPDKIRDFRPISLCNVAYKLVSKVLANRLKLFLNEIVSENQSAFTPGRLISDNILMAFEVFHYMKNARSKEGHMAIKLDMAKVYDRIEWDFLRKVLLVLRFDRSWVARVMDCVTSVTFAVMINGTPSEEFRPSRGLRQGDPLSPYLFILCAEALSNLMRRAVEAMTLHGIRVANGAPVISHLLFADDSIFFTRAMTGEVEVVKSILRRYEIASGQLVNLDKTMVSFSRGIPRAQRERVADFLGVREVAEHDRYLGLPTVVGRSKKALTDIIRDKL